MFIRAELKEKSKAQLKGRWAITGGLFLVMQILAIGVQYIPAIGYIVSMIIIGPLSLSYIVISLKVIKGESLNVEDMFAGFKNFIKALGLYLWVLLWVLLWSLLLFIPGIVKGISYSMAFYILAENPAIGIREALKESMRLTEGHKGELFVLGLSFIGWTLLALLTLGIGLFWLLPYMQVTYANAYYKLKELSTSITE